MNLHVLRLRLLDQLRHDRRALLVEQRLADLDVVQHFEEGERHTAADDHLVHLVQQVLDQLNLVGDLSTAQNRQERSLRILQRLREVVQLLLHQEAGGSLGQLHADHRAVRTMRRTERVVHVDVAQFGETRSELRHLVRVGLDLVLLLVDALAFLFHMETQVLQKYHAARRRISAGTLWRRTGIRMIG